jgi:hypothetical protein
MNFISTYLGLVADAKKMINIIANRLLYDEIIVKITLFYETVNADTSLLSQCWIRKGDTKWISFLHIYDLLLMPKKLSILLPTTIRQQKTRRNYIILLYGECSYQSAESMLSQKRGYKMIFISTLLWLVVDAKKIINIIANRLLDNKRLIKILLLH